MRYSINRRKFSREEYVWSFFLPFAFLLCQYTYGLGTIMLTYCILFSGFCVIKYQEIPTFKPLSLYTIWYVLVLLSTIFVFGHSPNEAFIFHLIQIIISGYCVAIIAKHLDKDALYKCWKILGLIVCAVVFFQFIQIFVFHQSVTPILLLPVKADALSRTDAWIDLSDRPVAFFTEPAMVVTFLTPVLLFAQQKKEWFVSIIVSVAILLSYSTSGIIALAILWGLSLFGEGFSRYSKVFILLLFIGVVILFLSSSVFTTSLEKINHELSGESGNMNMRMIRGWLLYAVLDTRSQLLGISDFDILSYVSSYAPEFELQTRTEAAFYLNTIQRILIQTGALGAVLYVWMLIRLWKSTDKSVKPYLTVVIVSMFYASNFYINGQFVLQYIVLLSYLTEFEGNKKNKFRKKKHYVQEVSQ